MDSRPLRIGEQLHRELATLLRSEAKDPRIAEIIICDVVVTKDLGLARIYFSPLNMRVDIEETMQGLKSAIGFFRTRLGRKLHLRKVPELRFIVDDTKARSERIEQLVQQGLDQ